MEPSFLPYSDQAVPQYRLLLLFHVFADMTWFFSYFCPFLPLVFYRLFSIFKANDVLSGSKLSVMTGSSRTPCAICNYDSLLFLFRFTSPGYHTKSIISRCRNQLPIFFIISHSFNELPIPLPAFLQFFLITFLTVKRQYDFQRNIIILQVIQHIVFAHKVIRPNYKTVLSHCTLLKMPMLYDIARWS